MESVQLGDYVKFSVENDVVHATPLRGLSYEETVEYFKFLDKARADILPKYKTFFLLIHGGVDQIVPEQRVRTLVAQWTSKNPIDGMAIYGMSPILRVALSLVMNAANLLRRESNAVVWLKDEAAARQWINNRRAHIQSQKGKGSASAAAR